MRDTYTSIYTRERYNLSCAHVSARVAKEHSKCLNVVLAVKLGPKIASYQRCFALLLHNRQGHLTHTNLALNDFLEQEILFATNNLRKSPPLYIN